MVTMACPVARNGMAEAQYIAGMGFSNVGLGIVHSRSLVGIRRVVAKKVGEEEQLQNKEHDE